MSRLAFPLLFLILTSLGSCTEVSSSRQYDGPRSMDFTKGLFILNKVKTSLPEKRAEELGGMLFGTLLNLTDSVMSISRVNLPEDIKSDKDFYLVPNQIMPIIRQYSEADFLIHMTVEQIGDEKGGLAYGDIAIFNRANVGISIYEVATGERVYKITTITNEDLAEGNRGLVITRSSEEIVNEALRFALDELSTHAKPMRKTNTVTTK